MEEARRGVGSRREHVGWYFYDWANSGFYTTVVTVFMGPYLTAVATKAADEQGLVHPLGIPLAAGSFFPYMVSLSVACQVLFLPILGAIADYSHRKKQMMGFFAYLGSLATVAMYFLEGTRYVLGGALFVLANLSFGASVVFYNAFLPEIASEEERDAVSSRGWAFGYVGGALLLVLNLVLYGKAEAFGISSGMAVRISLCSAGLWWGIFTLVPLLTLRTREPVHRLEAGESVVTVGFRQLARTLRSIGHYPHTLLYLVAFLLYNDGIQAVIALSSQFGTEELGLEQSTMIWAILLVQIVGIVGALGFGKLAEAMGSRRAIQLSLVLWTATVGYAYEFLHRGDVVGFYALAGAIGIVLGGSQALSRSLFSLMIPKGQESEYFSVYEVSDKGTSWLAPLFFGLVFQFTKSYRLALVSLILFFLLGLGLLSLVDVRRAVREAGNEPPPRV
jgi:MFS transporter, UMF1 family